MEQVVTDQVSVTSEEFLRSVQHLMKQTMVPDVMYISPSNYWQLAYLAGSAKYIPRMKGVKRKRRKK